MLLEKFALWLVERNKNLSLSFWSKYLAAGIAIALWGLALLLGITVGKTQTTWWYICAATWIFMFFV